MNKYKYEVTIEATYEVEIEADSLAGAEEIMQDMPEEEVLHCPYIKGDYSYSLEGIEDENGESVEEE